MSTDVLLSDIARGLPPDSTPGVRIADVIVADRARKDYGDLTSLTESIGQHGLLQPIGVLPGNRLLFGGRRLEACRRLGWESIPFTCPRTLDDTLALLQAERDENTCRKDMTPSELVGLGRAIEEQERPKAEERKHEGQKIGSAIRDADLEDPGIRKVERARIRETIGAGLGISGASYQRARRLVVAAETGDAAAVAAVERMDRSGKITPAYNAWKAQAPTVEPTPDLPAAVPSGWDRTREGQLARVEKARDLAGRGYRSSQIASALGLSEQHTRLICRREGITIHADEVIGRARRIDGNRVIEQTVRSAESSADLLRAVDYGALDRALLGEWVSSLSESLKALRSLKTTLEKELSRVPE